jgi:Family of unknown function (DUF5995)
VTTEAVRVGGLADRMAALVAAWDAVRDGRAVFLDCYTTMTRAVHAAIADERFADADWVARLLERFAEYYFDSIDGGASGRAVPEPWVLAHAAAVGYDAHPLQLLLAGVSAHINYDLVLTLVDVLGTEWDQLDEAGREQRHADYTAINAVIAETADLVQDRVLERRAPTLAAADVVLGRWDEALVVRLLTGWRNEVWRRAAVILDEPDTDRRAALVQRIERRCVRRARLLLV